MKNIEMVKKLTEKGYKVWNEKRIYINNFKVDVEITKKEGYADIAKIGEVEMFLTSAGKETLKTLENMTVYYDIEKDCFSFRENGNSWDEKFAKAYRQTVAKELRK